jgi:hypothetical protein
VNRSLRKHGVVLELRLAERRSVGGDDDQLGLAGLLVQSVSSTSYFQSVDSSIRSRALTRRVLMVVL